jgi:hypothetical protein
VEPVADVLIVEGGGLITVVPSLEYQRNVLPAVTSAPVRESNEPLTELPWQ